jgi:hypothetical protein
MKNAHGDKYDEAATDKVTDDLLEKYKDDYGAMIGAATSGFGKQFSSFEKEEVKTYTHNDQILTPANLVERGFKIINEKDGLATYTNDKYPGFTFEQNQTGAGGSFSVTVMKGATNVGTANTHAQLNNMCYVENSTIPDEVKPKTVKSFSLKQTKKTFSAHQNVTKENLVVHGFKLKSDTGKVRTFTHPKFTGYSFVQDDTVPGGGTTVMIFKGSDLVKKVTTINEIFTGKFVSKSFSQSKK